jgi:nickel-dependent lactate racemase
MIYSGTGSVDTHLDTAQLRKILVEALDKLGPRNRVLVIPPDFTRFHSHAGLLTQFIWDYYGDALVAVLPALGTHSPMTEKQIRDMFGDMPPSLFKAHDWRNDVVTLGTVPPEYVRELTEGKLDFDWPVQVNRLLVEGGFDLILSVGQVVPHEVIGMANYNKNIFVGCGGAVAINRSHYVGAVYGMERIMGRIDTPVRKLFNYGIDKFMTDLPIYYILTVMQKNQATSKMEMRGLYVGKDMETFAEGAKLSQKVNLDLLDKPLKKVVVYLDHEEFKSTWLGNKSVYRTRMVMADKGELIVLAPGLREFGEDPEIDRLIRKYGYRGTPTTLEAVKVHKELQNNLSAAAHLIHGSSEDRFNITYCPGTGMSIDAVHGVGFKAEKYETMSKIYDHRKLRDGFNTMPDGEEIFFISNPALGLWALKENFS